MRVTLVLPDETAGSNASSNASSAAAVTAAANALGAQPVTALSSMMNETVLSTSSPVVSRMRRIDVRVVLAIPDADASGESTANASATVTAIAAAANALTAQPVALASLLNATVISFSTSQVVIGHAVVPLVVSPRVEPASHEATAISETALLVILIGLVLALVLAIFLTSLWRVYSCWHDAAQQQLLAKGSHAPKGEMELASDRFALERAQSCVKGERYGTTESSEWHSAKVSERLSAVQSSERLGLGFKGGDGGDGGDGVDGGEVQLTTDETDSMVGAASGGSEEMHLEAESPEHTLVEHATERLREERQQDALEALRKRTSSFALPRVPSSKFTNVNDVTRGQQKSLARAEELRTV